MKKIFAFVFFGLFVFSGCGGQEVEVATDVVDDVILFESPIVLNLPDDWTADASFFPGQTENMIAYHKDSEVDEEINDDGVIVLTEMENAENLSFEDYFASKSAECLEQNPEPEDLGEDVLYVPACWYYDRDITTWTKSEVSGFEMYRSPITKIPESGEEIEEVFVSIDGKFILLQGVYSSYDASKREISKALIGGIFDALSVK